MVIMKLVNERCHKISDNVATKSDVAKRGGNEESPLRIPPEDCDTVGANSHSLGST